MKVIECLSGSSDWVTCRCGNEPHIDGFYSCANDGRIVSPTIDGEWQGSLYVCIRCGRYFHLDSLIVAGVTSEQVAYHNANFDWDTY